MGSNPGSPVPGPVRILALTNSRDAHVLEVSVVHHVVAADPEEGLEEPLVGGHAGLLPAAVFRALESLVARISAHQVGAAEVGAGVAPRYLGVTRWRGRSAVRGVSRAVVGVRGTRGGRRYDVPVGLLAFLQRRLELGYPLLLPGALRLRVLLVLLHLDYYLLELLYLALAVLYYAVQLLELGVHVGQLVLGVGNQMVS